MPLMGIGEYARHRAVDAKAIRRAVETGRITRRSDGLIDSDQADRDWEANTMHERGHNNVTPKVVEMPAGEPTDLPLNGERPAKGSDYAKARAATQIYEARLKKLRYEERAKTLVPARDVEDARFQEFRCLRDACMNIPSRLAAQLAAESDTDRCFQILEAELDSIFADFAEGKIA